MFLVPYRNEFDCIVIHMSIDINFMVLYYWNEASAHVHYLAMQCSCVFRDMFMTVVIVSGSQKEDCNTVTLRSLKATATLLSRSYEFLTTSEVSVLRL